MKRRICVITGTRAEYGLLYWLIREIEGDAELDLQIVATGMHLSPEFGLTVKEIEKDGFTVDKKIETLLSSDTPTGVCKAMGLTQISLSEAFEELNPDLVILIGDRFETFSAASVACIFGLPIAHLHGGELTRGAVDDAFRHAISKMSHLHFTSTEAYRHRVIQLGENPTRVFNVGAIGIDGIRKMTFLPKTALESALRFSLEKPYLLATFHPVTLERNTTRYQVENLLAAVDEFPNLNVIFTKSNADTEGRITNQLIDSYVDRKQERAISFASLGQLKYLSTMKYAEAVIGNSSSGIIEAPSLGIPTVNIGNRQEGRLQCPSVINCQAVRDNIVQAIKRALSAEFERTIENMENPYEKGNTANEIKEILKNYNLEEIIKKTFYDIQFNLANEVLK